MNSPSPRERDEGPWWGLGWGRRGGEGCRHPHGRLLVATPWALFAINTDTLALAFVSEDFDAAALFACRSPGAPVSTPSLRLRNSLTLLPQRRFYNIQGVLRARVCVWRCLHRRFLCQRWEGVSWLWLPRQRNEAGFPSLIPYAPSP